MHLTTGMDTYLYRFTGNSSTIVCPIAERTFRGRTDIVTPYGFSGFVGTRAHAEFPALWREFAVGRGWVCGYIALNPLLEPVSDYDNADVYQHNEVYVLDLSRKESDLLADMSQNRRRQLRAWAQSESHVLTDREALAEFVLREQEGFFRSRGSSSVYRFTRETWLSLFSLSNVLIFGATSGSTISVVTLFAFTNYVGEALFQISIGDGRRFSTQLLWHGAMALRKLGVGFLNLGGGVRPGDGVARFKQRFGGRVLPLLSLKQVYDPTIFEQLCREADADALDCNGYFPPYRTA
jgi:hypothetical protein